MPLQEALAGFERRFGETPDYVVRAPGRVNLIGDHTDYTGGLVLPIAIDRALLIAARVTDNPVIEVCSAHFGQSVRIAREALKADPDEAWSRYVAGVIALLRRQEVALPGAQLWIAGDIPPGGGLASSAALEVGVAVAMLHAANTRCSLTALATLCRQAEQEFAQSLCGIMDQLCCASAKADHALLIDCRRMTSEQIPLNLGDVALVVIDSGVRHSIAGAGYTTRRRECSAAVATINGIDRSITSLRDITEDRLAFCAEHLDDTLVRRVRHVVTENTRVSAAADALRDGDVQNFGRLMIESHASLRDDFEVSCEELEEIVSVASAAEGVYGARLTGGGFGGCVIVLASSDAVAPLESAIHGSYSGRCNATASVFTVRSADAAGLIDSV